MKIIRTSKGVTIELDWDECVFLKKETNLATHENLEKELWFPFLNNIHHQLDEILTEEGS